jgi:hypothetical protein
VTRPRVASRRWRRPSAGDGTYEVVYSWQALDLWVIPPSVLGAMSVGAHVSTVGPHLALLSALAAAAYPLLRVAQVGARRTAVRLDAEGVTFGLPWPWRVRRITVPWSELEAVVLWGRALRRAPQYVGLSVVKPDRLAEAVRRFAPHVDVVDAY